MKLASILNVKTVDTKKATDGREYKKVTAIGMSPVATFVPKMTATGMSMVKQVLPVADDKPRKFNVWAKTSTQDWGVDNLNYGNYVVGASIPGAFVTRDVPAYEIPRFNKETQKEEIYTATTATVAVIGDSTADDWDMKVTKAFKAQGYTIVEAVKEESKEEVDDLAW